MKKSARKVAVRKSRTVAFSRASTRLSTVKIVGLTLLAVLVLLAAVYIVNGALPIVHHLGTDIITPVARAEDSDRADTFGAQTPLQWLANTQRPITTPCPTGQSIRVVNPDGTVVCQPTDSHWTAVGSDIISNNPGEVQIGSGGTGTLNINTGTICLGGVCKTAWPAAGPGGALLGTDIVAVGMVGQGSNPWFWCGSCDCSCGWSFCPRSPLVGEQEPFIYFADNGRGVLDFTVTSRTYCCAGTGCNSDGTPKMTILSLYSDYTFTCKPPFGPAGPLNTWLQSNCDELVFPPPNSFSSTACLACKLAPPYAEPPPYSTESSE